MRHLGLLLLSVPGLASAQAGGFVTMLGTDTISVERYERTVNGINGQIVRRSPQTSILRYSITFNSDGSVAAYDQSVQRPDGSAAPNTAPQRMTFTRDSILRHVTQNGQATTLRAPNTPGTLPQVVGSLLFNELTIATAKRLGNVHLMSFGAQQQAPTRQDVRFFGSDTAEIVNQGFRTGFRLDAEGRIVRSDGSLTTQKFIGTRASGINIGTIASAWAARDAAGEALGAASTRDTARATIGSAMVSIDYGRPAARGREIWGKLVPYDTTWRVGANASTTLRTDRDLVIGGTTVPAGTYSLFLYPTATRTWLIINKQTGQWGTAHDAAQDFARILLEPHVNLAEHEERFRIFFAGNMLMLHWARGGYGVRVEAR